MLGEAVSVFLEAAELEYSRLTSYADALSRLSHAVASATKRVPIDQVGLGESENQDAGVASRTNSGGRFDGALVDRITSTLQGSELPHAASIMFDEIDGVRDAHAFLLDSLDDVVSAINEADATESKASANRKKKEEVGASAYIKDRGTPSTSTHGRQHRHTAKQRRWLQTYSILKDHTELSQRVVKTVCSAGVGVPIIHSNGMLATEETNDDGTVTQHQNRIVALASLRASIAKVKENLSQWKVVTPF
jgi:hypothetical protein